jgi:hypothetical protein
VKGIYRRIAPVAHPEIKKICFKAIGGQENCTAPISAGPRVRRAYRYEFQPTDSYSSVLRNSSSKKLWTLQNGEESLYFD